MNNPFFVKFNKEIDFQSINTENINEAVDLIISKTKSEFKNIYAISDSKRTFENTMQAIDTTIDRLDTVFGIIYILGYTHPDVEILNLAQEKIAILSKYSNEITLDEQLFLAVKAYSQTKEAKKLTGYKAKFLDETLKDFRRNGMELPEEKRKELKKLKDKLSEVCVAFDANIGKAKGEMLIDENETGGLPDDFKKQRRKDNGKYLIDLTYPSYRAFMKYAESDNRRKELYKMYLNRAVPENLDLLKDMLILRKKIANMLGFETFAHYKLNDKMAKNPDNVWNFENELKQNLKTKAQYDFDELLAEKKKFTNSNASTINAWEASFYTNKVLENKYQVDDRLVKEYFELNNVISGLFKISQHLFDVDFREIKKPNVWHIEVRGFEVYQDEKLKGRFYLDLFPRDNKYQHAAMFPQISGRMTPNGYQCPVAALVCNFPKPNVDTPSLLPHSEVETLFHEFGHLLHHILTNSELASMAGTSVAHDFVETPSQMFENWAWQYDSLKLFAKHYKTDEILPKSLHNKMFAAKTAGSGLFTIQQIFYGTIDMTLHHKYDAENDKKTTREIIKQLQNEITYYKFVEDTNFEAAFGHLNGYAASYYGYLWSLVFSEDVFSVFEAKGLMNKETGKRYRDIIVAPGSTRNEMEILIEFLGREPNQEAFLKSLGV